ncbi:hypothetical protein HDU98_007044 [Podochytrium sp. JEL0797]|nr:hypothetical protein HDU98_007044 [Podochytrium sp. JEL0797]
MTTTNQRLTPSDNQLMLETYEWWFGGGKAIHPASPISGLSLPPSIVATINPEALQISIPVSKTTAENLHTPTFMHGSSSGDDSSCHSDGEPTSPSPVKQEPDDDEEDDDGMDVMKTRKQRSNSLGSLYRNVDISNCKTTKKVLRRGSVTIFSCPYEDCNRSFDRSFNLRAHYSTHLGMKLFSCQGCDKKFTRRFDVKRHQHDKSPCFGCDILVDN